MRTRDRTTDGTDGSHEQSAAQPADQAQLTAKANPFVESFNSRVRDELLAVEIFSCLTEAKVMVEDYRQDYNRRRPHRAHGLMTPAAFAQGWMTAHQAAPASAELHGRYASVPFDAGARLTLKEPTNHQLSQ